MYAIQTIDATQNDIKNELVLFLSMAFFDFSLKSRDIDCVKTWLHTVIF